MKKGIMNKNDVLDENIVSRILYSQKCDHDGNYTKTNPLNNWRVSFASHRTGIKNTEGFFSCKDFFKNFGIIEKGGLTKFISFHDILLASIV